MPKPIAGTSKFKTRTRMMGIFGLIMGLAGGILFYVPVYHFITSHIEVNGKAPAEWLFVLIFASVVGMCLGGFLAVKMISLFSKYYWYPKQNGEK